MATTSEVSASTNTDVIAWHVHLETPPFCKSWWKEEAEERARAYGYEYGAPVAGPLEYVARDCPYKQEMEAAIEAEASAAAKVKVEAEGAATAAAMTETPVPSPLTGGPLPPPGPFPMMPGMLVPPLTGTAVGGPPLVASLDLHEILCDECGEPMDEHSHPTSATSSSTIVRTTGPRKKAADRPPCPHCGGPIHWNESGGKVNFECLLRQRLVAVGDVKDPLTERLPVSSAGDIVTLGEWIKEQSAAGAELQYGKMDSASGGAGTFAKLRPKAPPKATPTIAPPVAPSTVASIESVAASSDVAEALPKRARKAKDPADAAPVVSAEERKKNRRELLKKTKR
jgi:hypothetical protein